MDETKLTRRVVTGHNDDGQAVFVADNEFPLITIPSGDADFALIWTTAAVPADNNDAVDGRNRDAALTIKAGSVIRVVDLLPNSCSPMHRTNSIDYGIILTGHVELELDSGEKRLLGPGDIAVQRGTMHLWRNLSATEVCRVVWVLIQAEPYRLRGVPLPELHP